MDFVISNSTFDGTLDEDATITFRITTSGMFNAFAAVVSAIANVIIIFLIVKSPILRSTTNVYLANWCLCNLLVLISAPSSLIVFGMELNVSDEVICIWEETLNGILFGNLVFAAVLLIDWYASTYCDQSCSARCRNSSTFTIIIIWILIFVLSVISVSLCVANYSYPLTLVCFFMGYFTIFLLVVLVLVMRCIKIRFSSVVVEKSSLGLILVVSYFLCWAPNWVCLYGPLYFKFNLPEDVLNATHFFGFINAVVLLVLLYLYDKNFKKVFKETFGFHSDTNKEEPRLKETHNAMLL